jgi:hypothetical protein
MREEKGGEANQERKNAPSPPQTRNHVFFFLFD